MCVTLVANMTAKTKRAPEFTLETILLELLVQLTDQWKFFYQNNKPVRNI